MTTELFRCNECELVYDKANWTEVDEMIDPVRGGFRRAHYPVCCKCNGPVHQLGALAVSLLKETAVHV